MSLATGRKLDLADQVPHRFRPHVLLAYGGHPAYVGLMRRARMKSVAVEFDFRPECNGQSDDRALKSIRATGLSFESQAPAHSKRTTSPSNQQGNRASVPLSSSLKTPRSRIITASASGVRYSGDARSPCGRLTREHGQIRTGEV